MTTKPLNHTQLSSILLRVSIDIDCVAGGGGRGTPAPSTPTQTFAFQVVPLKSSALAQGVQCRSLTSLVWSHLCVLSTQK